MVYQTKIDVLYRELVIEAAFTTGTFLINDLGGQMKVTKGC